ncbi:hypothetical protein APUTEX25_004497, partial [Auxenochlorella protothecoides]
LLNRVKWAQSQGFLNPSDTYAFKTAPVFVDSLMECLGSLLGGARILAIPRALLKDPAKCIEALRLGEASIVAALPRVWRSWAAAAAPGGTLPPARVGVSSGEPLTGPALRAMRALLPAPARLLNLYGCTETAADATWADLSGWSGHSAAPIPVGRPLPGVVVAVCREESVHFAGAAQTSTMGGTQKDPVVTHDQGASALCELGSPGRVLVAGLCLAEGTTGDGCLALRWFEGLTRAREGPVSLAGHSDDMPDRMPFFDTGDWGCMDDARCLTLLGRADRCVKVSGTRVDLAELEMVLGEIEGVKEAVAWLASSLLALVFCNEPSGVVGDVDAGGPVRARPVTDIHHRVWIGTHARSMLILTISDGDPVAQFRQESIPLLGPVSAAVTFVPALQLAVAACLDGSVVGISCRARRGQPETVAWTLGSSELGMRRAPLFAPVAVCPGRTGLSVVAVSAVGGCARIDLNASLKDCDGCSPIALPCAPAPSGVYAPLGALGDGGLAMGCEDGRLCILQAYSGAGWQEQPLQISLPGLGSRITGLVHVTAPGTSLAQPLLVATTASGHVALLAPSEGAVPAWQIREAICLPAPIFSAPTFDVETGSLFLGCRDDHVYCLRIGH